MPENKAKDQRGLKEDQKEEALLRMRKWKLTENVMREFENGVLNCSILINIRINSESETSKVGYVPKLNWLTDEELEIVRKFEAEYGGLVYHIVKTHTDMGTMYSFLYVSKTTEEWEMDQEDIEDSVQVCYVYNSTNPDFSEFGSCLFYQRFGGLLRIS